MTMIVKINSRLFKRVDRPNMLKRLWTQYSMQSPTIPMLTYKAN